MKIKFCFVFLYSHFVCFVCQVDPKYIAENIDIDNASSLDSWQGIVNLIPTDLDGAALVSIGRGLPAVAAPMKLWGEFNLMWSRKMTILRRDMKYFNDPHYNPPLDYNPLKMFTAYKIRVSTYNILFLTHSWKIISYVFFLDWHPSLVSSQFSNCCSCL